MAAVTFSTSGLGHLAISPLALNVVRCLVCVCAAVAGITERHEVVIPVRDVWILSSLASLDVMDVKLQSDGNVTASALPVLFGDNGLSALFPITIVNQSASADPVVGQRADLFRPMRVQTGSRAETHIAVTEASTAKHPRLHREVFAAFLADQDSGRHPRHVGFAGVLALSKPTAIGCGFLPSPNHVWQSKQGIATSRAEVLAMKQARLHRHYGAALLAGTLDAREPHEPILSGVV